MQNFSQYLMVKFLKSTFCNFVRNALFYICPWPNNCEWDYRFILPIKVPHSCSSRVHFTALQLMYICRWPSLRVHCTSSYAIVCRRFRRCIVRNHQNTNDNPIICRMTNVLWGYGVNIVDHFFSNLLQSGAQTDNIREFSSSFPWRRNIKYQHTLRLDNLSIYIYISNWISIVI